MIGKSLTERSSFGPLSAKDAERLCKEALTTHAAPIVEVRTKDPRMVVCVVVRADTLTVRVCKNLGFDLKRGASAIFGFLGEDAARVFPELGAERHAWLGTPNALRETKVLLLSGGFALLSLHTNGKKVTLEHA